MFGGKDTCKVIYVWHVHRALKKAKKEHVSLKGDQITIYHLFCILLIKHKEAMFCSLLQEVTKHIYNHHKRFYSYFKTNYCTRLKHRATYYRVESTVNTNMFLEAFHRVLKIVYLHHKQNKHVNSFLVAFIKISRNTEEGGNGQKLVI